MIVFGLKEKASGGHEFIGIGLNPAELALLQQQRVVRISYDRLGLVDKLGPGQIVLFAGESDESVLAELRKRFDIDDAIVKRGERPS